MSVIFRQSPNYMISLKYQMTAENEIVSRAMSGKARRYTV
jgi:hypothetical protein